MTPETVERLLVLADDVGYELALVESPDERVSLLAMFMQRVGDKLAAGRGHSESRAVA